MTQPTATFTISANKLTVGQWIYSPFFDDPNSFGLYEVIEVEQDSFTIRAFRVEGRQLFEAPGLTIQKSRHLCLRVP